MEVVHDVATSQAVWAILCIALAAWLIRKLDRREEETRAESKQREDKLMTHLARSNESQERTAIALQSIESRMDRMEKIIYKGDS